jgi:uncharacterized integral membrane protein
MENEKQTFNAEESLQLITSMIRETRQKANATGFHLILWGTLISLLLLTFYILNETNTPFSGKYLWYPAIALGAIGSMLYGFLVERKRKTHCFLDRIYGMIWLSFFISWTIVLVFNYKIDLGGILVYVFAANAVFLTGILIKFKPFIFGSIVLWATAIASFLLDYPNTGHLLIGAAGMIFGYVVPGIMLNNKIKRNKQGQ